MPNLNQQLHALQSPPWWVCLVDPLINIGLRWLSPRLRSVRIEIGVPSSNPLYDERVTRIVFRIPHSMAAWRAHRVRVLQQYLDAAQDAFERQWEGVRTGHRTQGLFL